MAGASAGPVGAIIGCLVGALLGTIVSNAISDHKQSVSSGTAASSGTIAIPVPGPRSAPLPTTIPTSTPKPLPTTISYPVPLPTTVSTLVPTPYPDTTIFRYGYSKDGISKLVPTENDMNSNSGLSFSTVPRIGAAMTTMNTVNATGVLLAVRDGGTHVSIYPVGGTVLTWYSGGVNSIWTVVLASICSIYGGVN